MKIEKFEQIEAWKEARLLVKELYSEFSNSRDYGFRDQICRAGISIMSNIAEGFERKSNKEFVNFLAIARGSCAEVSSLLYAAADVGYIKENNATDRQGRLNKISGLINGFISYLKSNINKK